MAASIFFSETPEHFYQQLEEIIKKSIKQELNSTQPKEDPQTSFIKKIEVCRILQVSKPTVDSHVRQGFYHKHYVGSRVFYDKMEILSFIRDSGQRKS
jgi:predicted DNA-binding transcriptional regulator AlpA